LLLVPVVAENSLRTKPLGGEDMARPRKATLQLPEAIARRRKISVQAASAMVDVHEDTFRKHYSHLITRVGPRLERVTLGDVLDIGEPKR
jgi:hypothetical protein